MRFSRSDYDLAIVDRRPAGERIPDEEPVFLIRGQDENGPEAVRVWADSAERRGADPLIVGAARAQADAMEEYQRQVASKTPDIPPEA